MKKTLWILGAAAALLAAFGLGAVVGYRHAIFASQWGRSYYANFSGPRRGFMMGGAGGPAPAMHGAAGQVLSIAGNTLVVKDLQGAEQSVAFSSSTDIRSAGAGTSSAALAPGAWVVVIGGPGATGQIDARFIRIFGASSSTPPRFFPAVPSR